MRASGDAALPFFPAFLAFLRWFGAPSSLIRRHNTAIPVGPFHLLWCVT
jgi:hypothetical protein